MPTFHHRKLPDFSTLLTGRKPPDEVGFTSQKLQVWYNNTDEPWQDDGLHAHRDSDECFIVLKGSLTVRVEEEVYTISAGEFCCFPTGLYHAILSVETPVETFMIRAPSLEDKVYRDKALNDG